MFFFTIHVINFSFNNASCSGATIKKTELRIEIILEGAVLSCDKNFFVSVFSLNDYQSRQSW